jgi:hypothetical protein
VAYITFTDALGAATLRPNVPAGALAGRLRGWTPLTGVVGDSAVALGTGLTFTFKYRTDYPASFTLPAISAHFDASLGAVPLEIADRLVAYLTAGGLCTLVTEDNAGSTYVVAIAPGTRPALRMSDPRLLEYELALTVIRADGVQAPMTCRYGRTS